MTARRAARPRAFVVDRASGTGRADGVQQRVVARLRRGQPEADVELDLHGLTAREAAAVLREGLADSAADGDRCVLVIHGRGRSSREGPVLREKLPDWLTSAPLDAIVVAFAPAPPREGGAGATRVLLRRA